MNTVYRIAQHMTTVGLPARVEVNCTNASVISNTFTIDCRCFSDGHIELTHVARRCVTHMLHAPETIVTDDMIAEIVRRARLRAAPQIQAFGRAVSFADTFAKLTKQKAIKKQNTWDTDRTTYQIGRVDITTTPCTDLVKIYVYTNRDDFPSECLCIPARYIVGDVPATIAKWVL